VNRPMASALKAAPSDSFFSMLWRCGAVSLLAIVAPSIFHLPPWLGMAVGVLPLVYYHLLYLAPRTKKGLSQVAIDSVYYYGFLITVSALGMSALTLTTSSGQEPLDKVAVQFGLGLFATGYAVFARMHLNSILTQTDDVSPEAVLDRYVQRSKELVTNVEIASSQFATLAQSLMTKSQEVAETARLTTEKAMLDVTKVFDEQMRSTLASAKAGLTEIRGMVSETSFAHEREELARSVRATIECVTTLNNNLEEFSRQSAEGALASENFATTSTRLNSTLSAFHTNVKDMAGPEGSLSTASRTLVDANAVIAESTGQLGRSIHELQDMPSTVAKVGTTFKDIRALVTKSMEQMAGISQSAERLGAASEHLERAASATETLANATSRTSDSMPALAERVEDVDRHMRSLAEVVRQVEGQLRSLPKPAHDLAALSDGLREPLEALTKVLASAGQEAKSLAGYTAENELALERTRSIAADIAGLDGPRVAVDGALKRLGEVVERLHTAIQASTNTLDGALSSATTALETNVRRSSDAATLFTDRLSGVAQIIIDKTTEVRPS
jgi:DNA repair ATPase RecN